MNKPAAIGGQNRKPKKNPLSSADKGMNAFLYFVYVAFAFACVYPFWYIFINTISDNQLSEKGQIIFYPRGLHLVNYRDAMKIPSLANAAGVSVSRTVIGTLLVLVTSSFLGYMFTRQTLWKRKFWYRFVLVTMYFNAGLIPWYLTMDNLGLTNNFLGYVLPTCVSPFFIILSKAFVESIPIELQQAAEIDGAGTLRIFGAVILPVIQPIMATIAIFSAVGQWNAFQDTLLLMTDVKLYTLQFLLYQYINQASALSIMMRTTTAQQAGLATAATVTSVRMTVTIIVVLPILCVYPLFQRFFVKGIMIGAVKG